MKLQKMAVVGCPGCRSGRVAGGVDSIVSLATIGLLIGGGYLIYNLVKGGGLNNLLNPGNASNNATTDQNTATTSASDLASSQKTYQQSVPDSSLNGYATNIYQLIGNDGSTPVSDDTAYSVEQLLFNLNNSTDWFRLVQLFGTKQLNTGSWYNMCALTGYNCSSLDLPGLLSLAINDAGKQVINQYFQDMGNGLQNVRI